MASSSLPLTSPVEQTVAAAVRRKLLVDAIEEFGWTLLIALSGFTLLLLLGSHVFALPWLAPVLLAGLAVTVWRLRKRLCSPYRVAQILDRRLQLHDSLSTAYFLRSLPVLPSDHATEYQLAQADQLAKAIRPQASLPFSGGRIWTAVALLTLVSLGLFGTRYLVTRSFSFAPSLIPLQLSPELEPVARLFERKELKHGRPAPTDQQHSKATGVNGRDSDQAPETSQAAESRTGSASSDSASVPKPIPDASARSGGQSEGEGKASEDQMSQQQGSQSASADHARSSDSASNKPENAGATGKDARQSEKGANSPGVLNRMKDAMSSLMAKMQASTAQQPAQSSGQQGGSDDKPGDQSQAQGQPKAGKQSEQQKAQDGASNPSETAEGQAQGQGAEKQGTTQGKSSSDQSAQKGADAHSGVGQQDGDKAIKDAEDLKAMGKLADIIGKRSAELTGEMTVETSSGKQQLKTNYSGRVGQHSDSGGEINRDEVPLKFQSYVREYMEQVRKGVKGVQ